MSTSLEAAVAADATPRRILDAGMRAFASEGYQGATTRMIAAAAGVTLPVIAYHFGNKEGLHRACAEAIVASYREQMLPLVLGARRAADAGGLNVPGARALLGQLIEALVSAIAADPEQRLATDFVLREMTDQGPGFELLYKELWQPGIMLVADLLAIARGLKSAGEQERAGALMLLTSITAFTAQAPISLPVMEWKDLGGSRRSTVIELAYQMLAGLIGGPKL